MKTTSEHELEEMTGIVFRGKWLKTINENYSPFDPCDSEVIYICNQCGDESLKRTNYCANCGAKMKDDNK